MIRQTLASLALVLTATAAAAGGMEVTPSEPAIVAPATGFSWTGFYAGISGISGELNDGNSDFSTSGVGIQAGYLRDLGTLVLGAELAYSTGEFGGEAANSDWQASRVKLIGGYDAGRLMPYLFIGAANYSIDQPAGSQDFSDTTTSYGIGGRYAFGATGKFVAGLEYLVEKKDQYDNNFDLENKEVALRLDYRF